MKAAIERFISTVRNQIRMWRVEWEIYHKLFPHLNGHRSDHYPFATDEELRKTCRHSNLDAQLLLETIERQSTSMGRAYGDGFRHIMYREVNATLRAYAALVQKRLPVEQRIPQFVQ